jgi:hypothetical protein
MSTALVPLEGEIIDTPRAAEMEVARLRAVSPGQQAGAVTAMLRDAHNRLVACQTHDFTRLQEVKAYGHTLQEIAQQLRLGKELQLDADEFVRRAERGLGMAARKAQERGDILPTNVRRDRPGKHSAISTTLTDVIGHSEWAGNGTGIKYLVDDVSEEAFEAAIAQAREERHLSRANVTRKTRRKTPGQPEEPHGDDPPSPPQPEKRPIRKTARARKLIQQMSIDFHNYALAVDELDPEEIDREAMHDDIEHIVNSWGHIKQFLRKVRTP